MNPSRVPDLSLVMPCYNEEAIVASTIRRLLQTFERAGYHLEIIAVDNGSRDRTGAIIQRFVEQGASVRPYRVEKNEGYGHGVLSGLPLATAPWVGMIPADGQVDAEDVVRLYEAAISADGRVLAKVRRRFRMDGLPRKIVSIGYNLLVRLLWPGLNSVDINSTPKILPRTIIPILQLRSKNWLLDLEIMLKAHYMGLQILEFNVFGRMRSNGLSHIRAGTCWEFFRRLLWYRFSGELSRWRQSLPKPETAPAEARTLVASGGDAVSSAL